MGRNEREREGEQEIEKREGCMAPKTNNERQGKEVEWDGMGGRNVCSLYSILKRGLDISCD
jgi:hypothetical protein